MTIDDQLVYSKLETGKQIDVNKLQEIFEPYGVSFMNQRRARP